MPASVADPDVAVIGGSGLYSFLDDAVFVPVSTPFGQPSAPVAVGRVADRSVAFLPRHGSEHRFPAHRIPARANLWALRSLGVRQVVATCAAGSLIPRRGPGTLVVPDQLLDRTRGRERSFYDNGGAVHVGFADPYCSRLRAVVVSRARANGWDAVDGGTMAVVEGPRFSTRAESKELASAGASLVNMTGMPEAVLARELALCYAGVALITDIDAGVSPGEGVTQDVVFALFERHTARLRTVLGAVLGALPTERDCRCVGALDGMTLPWPLP